jgi:phage replication O-like protein O
MANPQLEEGYTRIAREIMNKLCRFRIPGEVRQVIDTVIQKTYGWNKKEDEIALSQIAEATGMSRQNVYRALNKAVKHSLVVRSDYKLRLNKNTDEWIGFTLYSKVTTDKPVVKSDYKVSSEVTTPVVKSDYKPVVRSEDNNIHNTKDTIKDNKDSGEIITTSGEVIKLNTRGGSGDINELQDYFLKVFELPYEDGSKTDSKKYWWILLGKFGKDVQRVKSLIDLTHRDNFWRGVITSSQKLYRNHIAIISKARENIPKVAVMPKEAT